MGGNVLGIATVERDRTEAPVVTCCTHCDLGAMAFCAGLTTQQFRRFMTVLGQASIAPATAIFREGDPAQHLYTITAGAVKLYKLLSDGRRQITAFLYPGDFFGLSINDSYAYTAESLTTVVVCRFPRRKLEALFDEMPMLEKKLLGATTQELAAAQEQMLLLGRKTAREKLATFLVVLRRRLSEKNGDGVLFALPMSRSDIADFLGLTIETVSRTLTGLRREGLISLPDVNHVAILRFDELSQIAEGA
ncbi:cyclic nucleotide-binding domain-containing protein [Telmatospirillum sp.]|uniref:cyclic nucleotide-binding domain-containing protein n=1 Tax=Telmatospirillum sp. TaxID=2079197 RepID=UPI00284A2C1D|nr:cyclic nucleotide-binding domain-containing protein [Telmatospirillum sp.]MDR3435232.1 cyclic nucleotide-binding domain-containing protein [Telmatospirillum sp.]